MHGVRAVPVRHHVRVRLDPGEQTRERHHLDDALARGEAVLAVDRGDSRSWS